MALTTEKKMLLAKIGIGLVIVGMLCGYTYVWLNWLDLEDAREAALIWHNFYRSRHGSPPLRRSANLDVIAQMCAKTTIGPLEKSTTNALIVLTRKTTTCTLAQERMASA
ncbi:hypothetical protein Ocin01_08154 [Orchesella cincta]|uniref:Uncharacterized protein n=1 Tax=Orchesella cincta TaxID=48709 RepID=A0A1D2MZQ9_ORCCI|nr:hypothetical protein Ocin01_08154 [Orchesella cincta]